MSNNPIIETYKENLPYFWWAIVLWIIATGFGGWSIYLFWVAGEAGILSLISTAVCAIAGAHIWLAMPSRQQSTQSDDDDDSLLSTGVCGGCRKRTRVVSWRT